MLLKTDHVLKHFFFMLQYVSTLISAVWTVGDTGYLISLLNSTDLYVSLSAGVKMSVLLNTHGAMKSGGTATAGTS